MELWKFYDKISKNLSWRKKEISNLWSFIDEITTAKHHELCEIQYKLFVVLIYAHLEWFMKEWWSCFLSYIQKEKKNFSELKHVFFEMYFKRQYDSWSRSIIDILQDYHEIAVIYSKSSEIETHSNINTEVFFDLINQFSLMENDLEVKIKEKIPEIDFDSHYWTFFRKQDWSLINFSWNQGVPNIVQQIDLKHSLSYILDAQILGRRNGIAHGEHRKINFKDLLFLKTFILMLLDSLQEVFYDSLENKSFLLDN